MERLTDAGYAGGVLTRSMCANCGVPMDSVGGVSDNGSVGGTVEQLANALVLQVAPGGQRLVA